MEEGSAPLTVDALSAKAVVEGAVASLRIRSMADITARQLDIEAGSNALVGSKLLEGF